MPDSRLGCSLCQWKHFLVPFFFYCPCLRTKTSWRTTMPVLHYTSFFSYMAYVFANSAFLGEIRPFNQFLESLLRACVPSFTQPSMPRWQEKELPWRRLKRKIVISWRNTPSSLLHHQGNCSHAFKGQQWKYVMFSDHFKLLLFFFRCCFLNNSTSNCPQNSRNMNTSSHQPSPWRHRLAKLYQALWE